MKRLRLLFTVGIGIATCIVAAQDIRTAYAADAKVLLAEGHVRVKSPVDADWKILEKGMWLAQGSEILTDANASCEMAIGQSAIKLQPNSRAVLVSLDPVKIDLQSGKIFSLVRGLAKGSRFEVKTPTAVASARGTGWGQGFESVSVFEDTVHVVGNSGEESEVPEGKELDIALDGSLGDLQDIPEEAKAEWDSFKQSAETELQKAQGPETQSEDLPPGGPPPSGPMGPQGPGDAMMGTEGPSDSTSPDDFAAFENQFEGSGGMAAYDPSAGGFSGGPSGYDPASGTRDDARDNTSDDQQLAPQPSPTGTYP